MDILIGSAVGRDVRFTFGEPFGVYVSTSMSKKYLFDCTIFNIPQ